MDEYFARLPEPGHRVLTKLRATIRFVLPRDATEIISYQIPAFARNGVIVWYAAFADPARQAAASRAHQAHREAAACRARSQGATMNLRNEPYA